MSNTPVDKELNDLLNELEDATWCSRGDVASQNDAARERERIARESIVALFNRRESHKGTEEEAALRIAASEIVLNLWDSSKYLSPGHPRHLDRVELCKEARDEAVKHIVRLVRPRQESKGTVTHGEATQRIRSILKSYGISLPNDGINSLIGAVSDTQTIGKGTGEGETLDLDQLLPLVDSGFGSDGSLSREDTIKVIIEDREQYAQEAKIHMLNDMILNDHYTSGANSVDYVPLFRLKDRVSNLEKRIIPSTNKDSKDD